MSLLGAVSGIGVEVLYFGHQAHAVLAACQLDKRFAHHLGLLSTGRSECSQRTLGFIVETDRYRLFHGQQCITNVILEGGDGSRGPEYQSRGQVQLPPLPDPVKRNHARILMNHARY